VLSPVSSLQTIGVSRRHTLVWLAGAAGSAHAALPPGEPLLWPEVSLLDGASLGPAQVRDVAWVVVFFSLSCGYCHRHNRRLQALAQRMRGQPLRVLGAVHDQDAAAVRAHVQQEGLTFPMTLESSRLHRLLSPRRITPLTCVLDRATRLREVIPGEMSEDDVMGLARWAQPV
jgi:peroxiredoxin